MKHIALRLIFTLTAVVAAAHSLAGPYAKPSWSDAVTGIRNATFKNCVSLPNGDMIWLGDREDSNGFSNLWVRRYTPSGQLLWNKSYPSPVANGVLNAIGAFLASGGNVVIGCRTTGATSPIDTYMIKIDQDGNKIGDATLNLLNFDVLECVAPGPGNSVLIGQSDQADRWLVARLDNSFNVVWSTRLGTVGQSSQWPTAIAQQGSDAVVCGVTKNGTQTDVLLARLSGANGAAVYSQSFGDLATREYYPTLLVNPLGELYFAYTHHLFEVDRQARLLRISDSGATMWTITDPKIPAPLLCSNPSGSMALVGTSQVNVGSATNRVAVFTNTGAVLWWKDLVSPDVADNFTRSATMSDDGSVTCASSAVQASTGDGMWLVNSVSAAGFQLFSWLFSPAINADASPHAVAANDHGVVFVGGEFTVSNDNDAYLFRLDAEASVEPSLLTVRLGRQNSGNLASLVADDNVYLDMCKFIVPNQTTPPINIELEAVAPLDYPVTTLDFRSVSKASTTGLQQNLEMWNWTTGQWERSTTQPMQLIEQSSSASAPASAYVQAGSRLMRARIRVSVSGLVFSSNWCTQFDLAGWLLRP